MKNEMRGMSMDEYYDMEHDLETVIERIKERGIKKMKERERIKSEHEQIKPYVDAVSGRREVPRSEIPPLFDAALIANLEAGVINQKINEKGEVVVFRVKPHLSQP